MNRNILAILSIATLVAACGGSSDEPAAGATPGGTAGAVVDSAATAGVEGVQSASTAASGAASNLAQGGATAVSGAAASISEAKGALATIEQAGKWVANTTTAIESVSKAQSELAADPAKIDDPTWIAGIEEAIAQLRTSGEEATLMADQLKTSGQLPRLQEQFETLAPQLTAAADDLEAAVVVGEPEAVAAATPKLTGMLEKITALRTLFNE